MEVFTYIPASANLRLWYVPQKKKESPVYDELRAQIARIVQQLVRGPYRVIVHRTGSAGGLDRMLCVPGASSFLDDVAFTYRREATVELVGRPIDPPFVRDDVAIQMAAAAYERASKFAAQGGDSFRPIIAVGITSAVSTDRSRHGDDHAIICIRTGQGFFLVDVQMDKAADSQTARDSRREEQAELIDLIALNTILWAAGLSQVDVPAQGLVSSELEPGTEGNVVVRPRRIDSDPKDIFDQMFWPTCDASGTATPIDHVDWSKYCLFPGSFNPLHYGHIEMARWMGYQTGLQVVFQISQHHPIKRELAFDEGELRRQLLQFRFRHPVVLTRFDGLYFEKARRFPGAHILMGADALLNMLDPRFYTDSMDGLHAELQMCLENRAKFWVVDREVDGVVRSLQNVEIPAGYSSVFSHLAAVNTISSSQIRAQQPLD